MPSRLLALTICVFYTLVFLVLGLALVACGDVPGRQGEPGQVGAQGSAGKDGQDGTNGINGDSCVAVQVLAGIEAPNGGALITCGSTSVLILNGEPGPQGTPGAVSPYALTEIIDPCGDAPGIYDEVILKTASGKLIASFSDAANGNNTRLSELVSGSYVTTDGSNCYFNVSNTGAVTW